MKLSTHGSKVTTLGLGPHVTTLGLGPHVTTLGLGPHVTTLGLGPQVTTFWPNVTVHSALVRMLLFTRP
jgi:hypothetical protein